MKVKSNIESVLDTSHFLRNFTILMEVLVACCSRAVSVLCRTKSVNCVAVIKLEHILCGITFLLQACVVSQINLINCIVVPRLKLMSQSYRQKLVKNHLYLPQMVKD